MKNKIGLGRDLNRCNLFEVVPRSVPFAVEIAASDVCNFKCIYCNHSTKEGIKNAKILSWDDFLVIADQLEELASEGKDDIKVIRFIGNGEPLLNSKLPQMIECLSKRKIAKRFEVTTNASLLTHEMSDRLIASGVTRLLISIQGVSSEKYKEICGISIDIKDLQEKIKYFYKNKKKCEVFIKTVNIALDSELQKKQFYEIFSPICDTINVENIMRTYDGVDYDKISSENIDNTTRYGNELKKKICCDTLFMYMGINSNGDVDCCGCTYPPIYVGNILKLPLKKLWNGQIHKKLMIKHLQGKRWEIPKCAKCASIEHYNGFEEDNLDEYRNIILSRVEKL